jgi:hypothetical protein
LPADVGKQLGQQRIVSSQHVGFGLTRNYKLRFSVQIYKEHSTQNPWNSRMVGKVLFISFLRRNPGLTLRRAEILTYGRLMRFNTEPINYLFKF